MRSPTLLYATISYFETSFARCLPSVGAHKPLPSSLRSPRFSCSTGCLSRSRLTIARAFDAMPCRGRLGLGRVCSLLAFPQVVVVCGGSRVVKASLESAKWASNVHVHVKVSHRSLAIIPFRSREAICYSTAFQNSRLFRTLNSCVTFSRYTRYLVPGRHLAGLYVTPNLGQKLQVTHAKHAFGFVTAITARKNHR